MASSKGKNALIAAAFASVTAGLLLSCATGQFQGPNERWKDVYERIIASMVPLDSPLSAVPSDGIDEFYDYYRFDRIKSVSRRFGYLVSGTKRIAIHRFDVENPKGTALLAHGYLDHSGNLVSLASRLAAGGFSVVTYDLPGHGFSDGDFASIGNFREYGETVRTIAGYLGREMPRPYYAFGHSTGASSLIEYSLSGGDAFSAYVFLAPLVRCTSWDLAKIGMFLFGFLGINPPRKVTESRDPEFDYIAHNDWLTRQNVDHRWISALFEWNESLETRLPSDAKTLIFQGDADDVVEWKWNIPLLTLKFPDVKVFMLEGATHLLPNELPSTIDELVEKSFTFFKNP